MGRWRFVAGIGGRLQRRRKSFAQHREFDFDLALTLLLAREFVAERLQGHLHMRNSDFKFGQ